MRLQYLALAALSSITYGIIARGAEEPESLLLPRNAIAQDVNMIPVVFATAEFRVTDCAAVALGLVHFDPLFVAEHLPFRPE